MLNNQNMNSLKKSLLLPVFFCIVHKCFVYSETIHAKQQKHEYIAKIICIGTQMLCKRFNILYGTAAKMSTRLFPHPLSLLIRPTCLIFWPNR